MLALREFFWGPWPSPGPPAPCGDITLISSFLVSAPVIPAIPSPAVCFRTDNTDFVVAAPLSAPQPNAPGLPVCITKFVVGVKEN